MLLYALEKGTEGEKRQQQERATLGNLPLSSEISQHGENVILVQHILYAFLTKREVKMSGYWPRSFLCFCVLVCVYFFNEPRRTRAQ